MYALLPSCGRASWDVTMEMTDEFQNGLHVNLYFQFMAVITVYRTILHLPLGFRFFFFFFYFFYPKAHDIKYVCFLYYP